jgi:hypothetical protein
VAAQAAFVAGHGLLATGGQMPRLPTPVTPAIECTHLSWLSRAGEETF